MVNIGTSPNLVERLTYLHETECGTKAGPSSADDDGVIVVVDDGVLARDVLVHLGGALARREAPAPGGSCGDGPAKGRMLHGRRGGDQLGEDGHLCLFLNFRLSPLSVFNSCHKFLVLFDVFRFASALGSKCTCRMQLILGLRVPLNKAMCVNLSCVDSEMIAKIRFIS